MTSTQNTAQNGHITGAEVNSVLRQHAEQQYAEELAELVKVDTRQRPPNWQLSPWAVRTYLMGGKLDNGFEISPKYIGNPRLMEIAISTLATDRALLLYGVPGTAKCVKHDTLVLDTRTGQRVTIAEACRKHGIELASLQSNYRLHQQEPTDYINSGIKACYRVTTKLGREIEVTINHPFLTIDGWQPLENLHIGDSIAMPRIMPFFGNAMLSDAHVKILAHLIAEGCLSQDVPYYTNVHPDMQHDFSEAVQEAFPELQAHWYPDGRMCSVSGGRRGNKFRNPCTDWLKDIGLMGTKSDNKFVPNIVFSLPKPQIALFLNRLFSGDGFLHLRTTKKQVTIDYASKSKQLIKDVQHLLLRFGINARFRQLNTGHYRLFIHGTGPCRTFLEEIGLLGRKYVEEAREYLSNPDIKANPNVDTIPYQVWDRLESTAITIGSSITTLVKSDRLTATYKMSRASILRGQNISRERLSRLALLVGDTELQNLAQSDIYWDTITSIEPVGEHEVYDLSMAKTHNFVANDFIIHNSWVSEHLSAAIMGDSALLIQGTAGTDENAIRYGWNYARLLVEGPSPAALVVSPMMQAMQDGKLARIEELTRIPSEVQDALITILSEKTLPVPELNTEVQAHKGFNVIATANNRDKGVNELSSALMRRFNTVILPVPDSMDDEINIVERRVASLGRALELPAEKPALEEIRRVVTIFRELRNGVTEDGQTKLKSPGGTLSTAEAISVINNGLAMAGYFGDGELKAADLAAGLTGAIVKDPVQDRVVWLEYLQTVAKEREGWKDLYRACREVL
ncbi:ATPase associated with various cellular activities AAA_5 [Ktedonobacter racemifer DSM 44963]|uniref:ATPase associated with various cellular activities AAA_5 n=1 Tax=Ktedonobacter racemifer DSM 44963 TaxID=485913 RepID=D6TIQ7_KTERA|nr:AAA family ATPase [Ktedonobacter racemifer]EFH89314.1 ATPase associated with various cellular activities AAA_5 [Ktedonobacter racemifer DSM 44963]